MPDIASNQSLPAGRQVAYLFPAVAADELAYALAIFVAAGSRKMTPDANRRPPLTEEEEIERNNLFAELIVHRSATARASYSARQETLTGAFAALWHEYAAHEMRDAICARVLCFHFLMEHTQGRVVERWTSPSSERLEEVFLDPVVVQGLGGVTLDPGAGLTEAALLSAIDHEARRRASDHMGAGEGTRTP